jgi:hypothetical protein
MKTIIFVLILLVPVYVLFGQEYKEYTLGCSVGEIIELEGTPELASDEDRIASEILSNFGLVSNTYTLEYKNRLLFKYPCTINFRISKDTSTLIEYNYKITLPRDISPVYFLNDIVDKLSFYNGEPIDSSDGKGISIRKWKSHGINIEAWVYFLTDVPFWCSISISRDNNEYR